MEGTDFKDFKAELLKNPNIRRQYEKSKGGAMKAEALIKRVVKKTYQGKAYVIAHIPEHDSSWHVHRDEEVPNDRPISVRIKV